jgi:hypothetical protein
MSVIEITKEQAALMVNIINFLEGQQDCLDENEEELRRYLEIEMLSRLTMSQAIKMDYHVKCEFKTSGYFCEGDGGAGHYTVEVAGTSVIDGISVFELDNGNQAHLLHKFKRD